MNLVKHKPGRINNVADMLSRLSCAIVTTDVSVARAQGADDLCQQIHRLLDDELLSSDYVVIDNILCWCGSSNLCALVLPAKMRSQTLELGAEHIDFSRTLSRLQARYWWPNLSHAVNDYFRACQTCQMDDGRWTTILWKNLLERGDTFPPQKCPLAALL